MSALLVAAGLVFAACGGGDGSASPPRSPEHRNPSPEIPEDGDTVVVQFTSGGGIAGPCCDRWAVPDLTVYGDGRVVIVDGTAGQVPALRQATVPRDDLADLFADASDAGLLDDPPPDTGTLCCDLSDTSVVLTDATTTHAVSVVGLGAEDNANAELTADQRATREAVIDLRNRLEAVAQDSDDDRYTPEELAVYVFATEVGPGVEPAPWPLDDSLAEGGTPIDTDGRCLHVTTGSDTVLAAAAARDTGSPVDDSTIWTSAGRTWHVIVRPLLPHEHACP